MMDKLENTFLENKAMCNKNSASSSDLVDLETLTTNKSKDKVKFKKISTTQNSVDLHMINQKTLMRIIVVQYLFSLDVKKELTRVEVKFDQTRFQIFLLAFNKGKKIRKSVIGEMHSLIETTLTSITMIDEMIKKYLEDSWPYERITLVNRAILRAAVASFLVNEELSHVIIFDEFIKITKWFGAESDYKFINAILEKISLYYKNNKQHELKS